MPATTSAHNSLLAGTPHPQVLYLQVHTGDPGPTGSDNVAVSNGRAQFNLATPSNGEVVASNEQLIDILAQETISHWSLHDAPTGGTCWWYDRFTVARYFVPGDTLRVPAGNLTLYLEQIFS